MRWPKAEPETIERTVLLEALPEVSLLDAHRSLGEGTRRALRLEVRALDVSECDDGVTACFVLPKGGYATTVLARACHLVDARARTQDIPDDQHGSGDVGASP
jgi:tRNA pseudouridine13 synthase